MHWCADETMALLAAIGFGPAIIAWLRLKFARFQKPHCCKPEHNHAE